MSEQKSHKKGVRSTAQKRAAARHDLGPVPPANPVAGAFGKRDQAKGYEIPSIADAGRPSDKLEELEEDKENEENPR